jgi:4-amino-4-deoxy-L-arabinose transferase-like glycosyltransferase
LLAAADAAVFAWWSARFPSGGWDGWAIWNQRARFLYEAGDSWRSAFSPALRWSHTDYPLLVPATVARAWRDLGCETTLVPVLLAAGFAVAVAALLVASLGALRGRAHALAAGALLLATPAFIRYAASQYADVALSYFILATIVLQCLAGGSPAPERWLALAGIAAGLAAWTKSEGLLWVVAAVAAQALILIVATDRKTRLKRIGAFLAGACPFLLTVSYFRRWVVVSWYFLGQNGRPQIGENLRDVHRYRIVTEAFAGQMWRFGSPLLSPVIFLAGYLLLSGIGVAGRHRPGLAAAGLALSLTAAGYYAIYMLTPEDPRWLLETSLDRLCLQLWPGVLFTAALGAGAIGRPDKA